MKQKKNEARQRQSGDERERSKRENTSLFVKVLLYYVKKEITYFEAPMKDEENVGSTF